MNLFDTLALTGTTIAAIGVILYLIQSFTKNDNLTKKDKE